MLLDERRDLGDGLDGPQLVVRVHDADQRRRPFPKQPCKLGDPQPTRRVHGSDGQVPALALQFQSRFQDRGVLDGTDHQVPALARSDAAGAEHGQVVGFGGAAREDDLFRMRRTDGQGHRGTCGIHRLPGRATHGVRGRRVAIRVAQEFADGALHLGMNRGRRVVVEIDHGCSRISSIEHACLHHCSQRIAQIESAAAPSSHNCPHDQLVVTRSEVVFAGEPPVRQQRQQHFGCGAHGAAVGRVSSQHATVAQGHTQVQV